MSLGSAHQSFAAEPVRVSARTAAAILEAFDELTPGRGLHVAPDAPAELLRRLQMARKGQFEWIPVAPSRSVRVVIVRRDAARGALRTVSDALSWDHDRLDYLETRAFAARERGDRAGAEVLFASFAWGLRRHIRFEEELLFPEFEASRGLRPDYGPTVVMRDEHREILDSLNGIQSSIGKAGTRAESMRHALQSVLVNHNLREEAVVYPGTDQALTPDESDALVGRIQAL